LLYGG